MAIMTGTITRRAFLKGSGAAITGAGIPGTALMAAEASPASAANGAGAAVTAAGPMTASLNVNGVARTVAIEPQQTLAEVLRGPLDLTGTKIGCDRGACSACTVWVDRVPIASCMILAADVGSRKVVTIEGLANGEQLHPVQAEFIAHDAVQCGFCTPGMVMSCAALVERNPAVSLADIKAAISGHLCRCGTFPHVFAATLEAAKAVKT
jgi:carbon-monoxide dehydrogenase small subunit/xanthine dehydrogenase YagT iron-sulfur-binding subunit